MSKSIFQLGGVAGAVLTSADGLWVLGNLVLTSDCGGATFCRGLSERLQNQATAAFYFMVFLALAGEIAGALVYAMRGPKRGILLLWSTAFVLMYIVVYFPYWGVGLVPMFFLALVTAITATIGRLRPVEIPLDADHQPFRRELRSLSRKLAASFATFFVVSVGLAGAFVALGLALGIIVRPTLWVLPPGFRGWVSIEYGNPRAVPLPTHGVYLIVKVPPTGVVCTSSEMPTGISFYRFIYVFSDGREEEIPRFGDDSQVAVRTGYYAEVQSTSSYPREAYFVGSAQQQLVAYASEPGLRDDQWPGCG